MTDIVVFGGTGFLGRRIVAALHRAGAVVRVAVRRPDRVDIAPGDIVPVACDIRDADAVAHAVDGAAGAINAVSAYVERGGITYRDIHVTGAGNLARAAAAGGLRLVQLSGIGSDAGARDAYIRARGAGEAAVREALPGATILRPSVMAGADDSFLNAFAGIARLSPVVPLIGADTKLQPADVEDVAAAAARALDDDAAGRTYELGGPEVLTLREIVARVLAATGRRRLMVPVPLALARPLAVLAEELPGPPLTRAQVALLEADNLADPTLPGFAALGVAPRTIDEALAALPR